MRALGPFWVLMAGTYTPNRWPQQPVQYRAGPLSPPPGVLRVREGSPTLNSTRWLDTQHSPGQVRWTVTYTHSPGEECRTHRVECTQEQSAQPGLWEEAPGTRGGMRWAYLNH